MEFNSYKLNIEYQKKKFTSNKQKNQKNFGFQIQLSYLFYLIAP